MKKFSVFLVSILLLSFGTFATAANLRIADNPAYLDATGISTGSCTLINGDGSFSATPAPAFTLSARNPDGNAMFKCRGPVTAPPGNGAVIFDNTSPGFIGVQCDIYEDGNFLGSTDDWQQIVSAKGNGVLTCTKH